MLIAKLDHLPSATRECRWVGIFTSTRVVLSGLVAMAALPCASFAAPSPASSTAVFRAHCAMCHQADAQGLPGRFPRLEGRATAIAMKPQGRTYLLEVLLSGMTGKIMVDDKAIAGFMPPQSALNDAAIADALNFAIADGKAELFTPAEVALARAKPKRPMAAVKADRDAAQAQGLIP